MLSMLCLQLFNFSQCWLLPLLLWCAFSRTAARGGCSFDLWFGHTSGKFQSSFSNRFALGGFHFASDCARGHRCLHLTVASCLHCSPQLRTSFYYTFNSKAYCQSMTRSEPAYLYWGPEKIDIVSCMYEGAQVHERDITVRRKQSPAA